MTEVIRSGTELQVERVYTAGLNVTKFQNDKCGRSPLIRTPKGRKCSYYIFNKEVLSQT